MKTITIQDKSVWIGENSQDNWNILARAKQNYWFFHLTSFPSCYVIFPHDEITPSEIYEVAGICRDNTKHKRAKVIKVDCTRCGNVKRGSEMGECVYISKRKVKTVLVK